MASIADVVEDVFLGLFLMVLAFGMYVIAYFWLLRYKGIITSGYRITASVFDNALCKTQDPKAIEQLQYGKKIYYLFVYAFVVAIVLLIMLYLFIKPE